MVKLLKNAALGLVAFLIVAVAGFALWWSSVDLGSQPVPDPKTTPSQLAYLSQTVTEDRGTILAVVTSTGRAGDINTGYELTELARAYYVFKANGYDVQIASPKGGPAPVNIDDELTEPDYAFLNDPEAQRLVRRTQKLADVDHADFVAVYFVGGKGAMFDFAGNPDAQNLAANIYDAGGVVGAVCHGPAALIGARLADGAMLLDGKAVAGFTNDEELFLIPEARSVFPFLLEDGLKADGARYSNAPKYLAHTVSDGRLVTGQNPWSTWSMAEAMVRALGHQPVVRAPSPEELANDILATYHADGLEAALSERNSKAGRDKRHILLHALIALMDGQLMRAYEIQRLAH